MGILDLAEEAAGAFGADKALEAVDPNANLLEKVAAAAVGFEGVKLVKDHLGGGQDDQSADAQPADGSQDAAPDASGQ
jgi:hypothetical protein